MSDTIHPALVTAYRRHKIDSPHMTATQALTKARLDVQAGKPIYAPPRQDASRLTRTDNPWKREAKAYYVEALEDIGARLIGYSDKICDRLRHTGWFTDEFQDSSYRGVVVQLPGRNGKARITHGYQESDNGGFVIDLASLESMPACDYFKDSDDVRSHARQGDSMAENAAEKTREYNDAWRAGSDYRDLGDTIAATRKEALAILGERKGLEAINRPALCAAIRAQVESLLSDIRDARKQRAGLIDSVWREYYSAFNDGAGAPVLKPA